MVHILDYANIFLFVFTGPTSFAPIIDAAIDIVEGSNGQYHVLVIIADGQVVEYVLSLYCFLIIHMVIFASYFIFLLIFIMASHSVCI